MVGRDLSQPTFARKVATSGRTGFLKKSFHYYIVLPLLYDIDYFEVSGPNQV